MTQADATMLDRRSAGEPLGLAVDIADQLTIMKKWLLTHRFCTFPKFLAACSDATYRIQRRARQAKKSPAIMAGQSQGEVYNILSTALLSISSVL